MKILSRENLRNRTNLYVEDNGFHLLWVDFMPDTAVCTLWTEFIHTTPRGLSQVELDSIWEMISVGSLLSTIYRANQMWIKELKADSSSKGMLFCFCYFSLTSWTATEKGCCWGGRETGKRVEFLEWQEIRLQKNRKPPPQAVLTLRFYSLLKGRTSSQVHGDTERMQKQLNELGKDCLDSSMAMMDFTPEKMTRHKGLKCQFTHLDSLEIFIDHCSRSANCHGQNDCAVHTDCVW